MRTRAMFICLSMIVLLSLPLHANAYTFNGAKIKNPNDAYYWIQGANGNFTTSLRNEIKQGVLAWNQAPKINFTTEARLPAGDAVLQYQDKYNGTIYASYNHSNKNVTFFKKWRVELNKTERIETAIHEVGHALGLGHTQKTNDSISVMRQFDFNNKTKILSDDLKGINAKY